jgi:nucleoside-diphosphate-sugar epimerase
MRFLVTGASGFVGKHLCAELLSRGQTVRAAVRASSKLDGELEQVIISTIDGDTNWSEALRDVDVVIHLAARVHILNEKVGDSLSEFLKVNLHGTQKLASQAAHAGVRRLVYVGSIGVNGHNTDGRRPFSEQDVPTPCSPYAVSKWQAELALQALAATGLEITVVRPPLVYGAEAPGNVAEMLRFLGKRVPLPLASVHNMRSSYM